MIYAILTLIALVFVALVVTFLLIRYKSLSGEDLSRYDSTPPPFATAQPSDGLDRLNAHIHEMFVVPAQAANAKTGWKAKRKRFDDGGLARDYGDDVEFRPDVISVDGHEMTGSWTLLPGTDPDRRLLYMHGGGMTVGSDISHRPLTVQLARRTGMAVFAPNYRLMPENSRRDINVDAQAAYRWILDNGPNGKAPITKFALAGDSAGGNLVLLLSNWARKHADRQPDAVIGFSPSVDSTFASPSMKENLATDHMLRPMVGPLMKAPRFLLLSGLSRHYGILTSDPEISPIFDDLSNLPPTFIQASQDEILRDDAIRFAAKAKLAGSPVSFQIWAGGLPHVWPLFDDYIPEANAALDEVEHFLEKYC